MVRQDFSRGTEPGVFTMDGAKVGLATCYEAAFDWAVRDEVTDGAQMISVPSNNATFDRSEMTYQQLAMSRVRAVEHSRTVTVPVTSGVSAIIMPDGKITQKTGMFVAGLAGPEGAAALLRDARHPARHRCPRCSWCWSPPAGSAGRSGPGCAGGAPVACSRTPRRARPGTAGVTEPAR